MRALVLFCGEPFYLQMWQELLYSIQTGKPAWEKVHGLPFFEYLRRHPEAGTLFDEAMTSVSEGEARAVAAAYGFSHFRTLVDVGGGHGKLLTTILRATPHLRGLLYDQPQVVDAARDRIASAGFADRCDVVGGDFLQSVPRGGDAYILKYIIHDWDDKRSTSFSRTAVKQ
jgi:hypothetical protein